MTVVGILAVYFLAWPVVRPADPLSPVTFLPLGGYGSAVWFAAVFFILVAACAVATVAVRPVGALLAATLSAGAVSLRSQQIRALLWVRQDDLGGLYHQLMLEAAMLAVLAGAASLIVLFIRRTARGINENWLWKDPMAEAPPAGEADGRTSSPANKPPQTRSDWRGHMSLIRVGPARGAGRREAMPITVARSLACAILAGIIAVVILVVVMQSADRGQIIFALVTSFTVGLFFAHQIFPQPYALVVWILPMLIAVGFYAAAWTGMTPGRPDDWAKVNMLYRALPVDWLTAGGGGALLGFWISQRVHEFRHVHHHHQQGQGGQ